MTHFQVAIIKLPFNKDHILI